MKRVDLGGLVIPEGYWLFLGWEHGEKEPSAHLMSNDLRRLVATAWHVFGQEPTAAVAVIASTGEAAVLLPPWKRRDETRTEYYILRAHPAPSAREMD